MKNKPPQLITPVVIAAIIQGNKFLLTKRAHLDPEDKKLYHNAWQLPGGEMEFGETPQQTLQREMKEEINQRVEIISLIPKIYTEVRANWHGLFIVYLSRLKNKRTKIRLNNEASAYKWMNINEVTKVKTLPRTMEIIKDALELDKIISAGERT